jgi:hypothetical protein
MALSRASPDILGVVEEPPQHADFITITQRHGRYAE